MLTARPLPLHGRFFVTGTDTEVGKTWVCSQWLQRARAAGQPARGFKPVAAGADVEVAPGQWRNSDALALQQAAGNVLAYDSVNPVLLPAPLSPHLAAAAVGRTVTVAQLQQHLAGHLAVTEGLTLVEGAGGWRVPLNDSETLADLARVLALPVVLVVRLQLGCINHALLTAEAIAADGLTLAGWVANQMPGTAMAASADNVATLRARLPAPQWHW